MLFEKILRRICPCYYTRTDDSELLCMSAERRKEQSLESSRHQGRFAETVLATHRYDQMGGNDAFSAVDYWGGSFNLVRPQPLYASPTDGMEFPMESHYLLRPPLYWKRAMKCFSSTGPPVFQEYKRNMELYSGGKDFNLRGAQKVGQSDSDNLADLRSVASEAEQVSWVATKIPHDFPLDHCGNNEELISRENCGIDGREEARPFFPRIDSISGNVRYPDDDNRVAKNFRVFPDVSYGDILFSASHHSRKKQLLLKIDRLENLSLKGRNGSTYSTIVKISLFPSNKYVKITKVLKKSSSPEIKEDFNFSMKGSAGKFLRFSVFDVISQNAISAIGHALLSLDSVTPKYSKKFRMKLYRQTQPHETPGNLALSLNYDPDKERLTVSVDKGKNLVLQGEKNVKMNTYVKGTLYNRGKKVKSKRTRLVTNTKNPKYYSTFTFRVKEDHIDDLLIVVSVRLKSFLKDATIGRVILGPFFITDRKKLTPWGRVFLKKEFVSHWFRLYL